MPPGHYQVIVTFTKRKNDLDLCVFSNKLSVCLRNKISIAWCNIILLSSLTDPYFLTLQYVCIVIHTFFKGLSWNQSTCLIAYLDYCLSIHCQLVYTYLINCFIYYFFQLIVFWWKLPPVHICVAKFWCAHAYSFFQGVSALFSILYA